MSNLEQIIRPAAAGAIRPPPPPGYFASPIFSDPNIVTWGSSGGSVFELQAHQQATVPPAKWPKNDEQKRKYDVIRVKNPDDPTQHVDVEAMTEYVARNRIDKSRITLRYAPQGESENVEVLSRNNTRNSSIQEG